jgi:hypothetical protein
VQGVRRRFEPRFQRAELLLDLLRSRARLGELL